MKGNVYESTYTLGFIPADPDENFSKKKINSFGFIAFPILFFNLYDSESRQ